MNLTNFVALCIMLVIASLDQVTSSSSTVRYPLDLYFLVDNSASIGVHWTAIVNFANDLQSEMAALAGGYYINSTYDGLRVAITAFSCDGTSADPKPRAYVAVAGPTGNEAAIKAGIAVLDTFVAHGGTCPSTAIQSFNKDIATASQEFNPPRPSVMIVLTDGGLWKGDVADTHQAVQALVSGNDSYAYCINYGGGALTGTEWSNVIGNPSHVFDSTNLNEMATLLSVIMLGKLSVAWGITAQELADVAKFSSAPNTVCLGESDVPLYLNGRAITLIGAKNILCQLTLLQTNATFTVQAASLNSQVYCGVPISLDRSPNGNGGFYQSFTLIIYSDISSDKREIFTVSDIQIGVVPCINAVFQSTSGQQGDCFPPLDASNSSYGVIILSGPTVNVVDGSLLCNFDNGDVVQAQVVDGSVECAAPIANVELALSNGQNPLPFSRFTLETLQGVVLLDSSIDTTSFVPVSCISTSNSTKFQDYCWNSQNGPDDSYAIFQGQSLTNLLGGYSNLEFTCTYTFNGFQFNTTATADSASSEVFCGDPPLSQFFNGGYAVTDQIQYLAVALRVRSSIGSSSRGWWILQTDSAFPVIVSPCFDISPPSIESCAGGAFTVSINGSGVGNIITPYNPSCYFVVQNEVLAAVPITVISSSQATCTLTSALPNIQVVEIKDASVTYQQLEVGVSAVVPCFDFSPSVDPSSPVCWGTALANDYVTIEGTSAQVYSVYSTLPLPSCQFSLVSGIKANATIPVTNNNKNGLTCSFPEAWATLPPLQVDGYTVTLVDSNLNIGQSSTMLFVETESCVVRADLPANPVDAGQSLPDCSPDCCLTQSETVAFSGPGALDITSCEWLSSNGSVLSTTVASVSSFNTSIMQCDVPYWVPPVLSDVLPVVEVVAYDSGFDSLLSNFSLIPLQPCVYATIESTDVVLGGSLIISFGGPTVRDIMDDFALVCVLTLDGAVDMIIVATAQNGALSCDFSLYDSLVGAGLELLLFPPSVLPVATVNPTTASPTVAPVNPSKSPTTKKSGRRQLSSSSERSIVTRRRQLQVSPQLDLSQGTNLFSQTLPTITVSAEISVGYSTGSCLPDGSTLTVAFTGPDVATLGNGIICSFEVTGGLAVTENAKYNSATQSASCSYTPSNNVTFEAYVMHSGSNQTAVIATNFVPQCPKGVLPPSSTSPTTSSPTTASPTTRAPSASPTRPTSKPTKFATASIAPTNNGTGAVVITTGDLIGIIIGVICAFLLCLLLIFCLCYRQRKREVADKNKTANTAPGANGKNGGDEIPVAMPATPRKDGGSDASKSSYNNTVQISGTMDEELVIMDVVPPLSPVGVANVEPSRKFQIGDCVQVYDPMDDVWRFTFVRNFAPNSFEYILEDERVPIPESRIRWPLYASGETVEVKRGKMSDWLSGVVAYADPAAGMIQLVGDAKPIPYGDIRPAPFQVGESVEERGADHEWRPAVIVRCDPDGTYIVDGAGGLGLPRTRKRLRWPQFHGGDIVEVRRGDIWKRATVVATEGSVVVGLEDGTIEPKRFANVDVRRPVFNKSALLDTSTSSSSSTISAFAPKTSSASTIKSVQSARFQRSDNAGAVPLESSSLSGAVAAVAVNKSFSSPPPKNTEEEEEVISPIRKFKKREPLDFQELPDFCFEITVDKSSGLGVRFGWTSDQQVVVQKFLALSNSDIGSLEASERVSLGDQLLAVNGISVGGRSFAEVTDMIRSSPDRITLKFGRWQETIRDRLSAKSSGRKSGNTSAVSLV